MLLDGNHSAAPTASPAQVEDPAFAPRAPIPIYPRAAADPMIRAEDAGDRLVLPAEVQRYKSLAAFREALLAYLDRRAA